MIGSAPLLVCDKTADPMLNTLARAFCKLIEVAAFLIRGGLVRLWRYEVYVGAGWMLPDQAPVMPRRCLETGSLVVRLGGGALVVSRLA